MSEFYSSTAIKKTQRARRCDWCGEQIEKGGPSTGVAGVFEGDFFFGRYHPECHEAIDRYYRTHQCWGESFPEDAMNRGGIERRGDPEE